MFDFRMISLSMLALLGFGGLAIAGSSHPNAETVRAALENHVAKRAAQPAAAATPSALVTFSMLGSATSMLDDTAACPGVTCNGSGGDCNCLTLQGSLDGTDVGKASWTSTVTVNVDDCINTGTTDAQGGGFCCFAGGPLSASSGANTLAMSFTGLLCEDPNAGDQFNVQGGFIIIAGAGKFANSAGTGQLDMSVGTDAAGTTYLSGNGLLQIVSPF
jgi:hypothetical protein